MKIWFFNVHNHLVLEKVPGTQPPPEHKGSLSISTPVPRRRRASGVGPLSDLRPNHLCTQHS